MVPQDTSDENPIDSKLQLMLIVIILFIIIQELAQIASLDVQYFREAESWIKLGALVTSSMVIFARSNDGWVQHTSALVSPSYEI